MKTYSFLAGGSAGKGDTWDYDFDFDLTDEEGARLEASARKESRWHLDEDPEISDIYEKVYEAAFDNEIDNFMDTDIFEEELEVYLDNADWNAPEYSEEFGCWIKRADAGTKREIAKEIFSDRYSFNVCYPVDMWGSGVETDEDD